MVLSLDGLNPVGRLEAGIQGIFGITNSCFLAQGHLLLEWAHGELITKLSPSLLHKQDAAATHPGRFNNGSPEK